MTDYDKEKFIKEIHKRVNRIRDRHDELKKINLYLNRFEIWGELKELGELCIPVGTEEDMFDYTVDTAYLFVDKYDKKMFVLLKFGHVRYPEIPPLRAYINYENV